MRLVFGTVDLPDTSVAPRVLDRFYAAGGRALDVANVYRDGESAQAVGRWLRERHSPDGVVLYAKGCHPPNCLPELVPSEVDEARRLLGVERIDVFVLHRDDPSLPVAAFADALLDAGRGGEDRRLRSLELDGSSGTVSSSGISTGPARTDSSSSATTSRSPRWWPSHGRAAWPSTRRICSRSRTPTCSSSPGRASRPGSSQGVTRRAGTAPGTGAGASGRPSSPKSSGPRRSAVALAYVLHQPDYVLPVVGTLSEDHLDEALSASELELSPAQLEWLESGALP